MRLNMLFKFTLGASAVFIVSALLPIRNASASGEDMFIASVVTNACKKAGYFATPAKSGTACNIRLTNSFGNSQGQLRYWVQYKKLKSAAWKSYGQIRRWSDKNRDSQEDFRLTVSQSQSYRVVGDYNNNGIPDFYSNQFNIYVK